MRNVVIERLPETKETTGAKRWVDEKGEFVQVSYKEDIGHVAVFELPRGQTRGGHYHERKEEVFYVLHGRIEVDLFDPSSGEKDKVILVKGVKLRVGTRIWHSFLGIEDSLVIEYSPQYYDMTDSIKLDMGG